MESENPYRSPKGVCENAPEVSAQADQPGEKKTVRAWFLWVFPIVWNAPLVATMVYCYIVYKPLGPWDPVGGQSFSARFDACERAFCSVAMIEGWLLALMCYALVVSARLHRLVFQPWVTMARMRGPLLACGLLWTVLPAIAAAFCFVWGVL